MTDHTLDDLLRSVDPAPAATVHELPLHGADIALRNTIARGDGDPWARRFARGWSRRPLPVRAATAGLATMALLGTAAYVADIRSVGGDGAGTAWSAPVLRVAETSPRLLVRTGGWRIDRADQFAVGLGEVLFTDGAQTLQLNWYPAASRPAKGPDTGLRRVGVVHVDGAEVRVDRYEDIPRYVAAWRTGGRALELDGTFTSDRDALAVMGALHPTDTDTWLSALPESVVRPGARGAEVDAMLADVPLPPGFDVQALRNAPAAFTSRYNLAADVTNQVSCAWLTRWATARRTGDRAIAAEAVAAMATSHRWKVLLEVAPLGAWSQSVWELADAMPGDGQAPSGKTMTLSQMYSGPDSPCPR